MTAPDEVAPARRAALGLGMASLAATRAEARVSAGYIVLLGDSVFDNAAFVDEGREVVAQLRGALSTSGWRAMLAARRRHGGGCIPSACAPAGRRHPPHRQRWRK
ncbi:hypothetical protein ACFQU2_35935 [Siccirubricoccus deserti]